MTSLLLLLACTGFSATSTPVSAKDRDPEPMATRPGVTPAVVLPTTPLVQQECFASANEYRRYRSGAVPPPSPVGSAAAPKAAPVTAAPSSAAAPAAAPAPAMASTGAMEGAALGRGGATAGDALAGGAAPRQSPAADKATESKSAPAKPKESAKPSAKASGKPSGVLLYSVLNRDADRWELWEYSFATAKSRFLKEWRTEVAFSHDYKQVVYYAWPPAVGWASPSGATPRAAPLAAGAA